jgi:hypothetical protein
VAQCVIVDGNGFIVADATPVASCTGFVLASSTEFQDMQSVLVPLSVEDGMVIGQAILLAWAVAFMTRPLRSLFDEERGVEGQ